MLSTPSSVPERLFTDSETRVCVDSKKKGGGRKFRFSDGVLFWFCFQLCLYYSRAIHLSLSPKWSHVRERAVPRSTWESPCDLHCKIANRLPIRNGNPHDWVVSRNYSPQSRWYRLLWPIFVRITCVQWWEALLCKTIKGENLHFRIRDLLIVALARQGVPCTIDEWIVPRESERVSEADPQSLVNLVRFRLVSQTTILIISLHLCSFFLSPLHHPLIRTPSRWTSLSLSFETFTPTTLSQQTQPFPLSCTTRLRLRRRDSHSGSLLLSLTHTQCRTWSSTSSLLYSGSVWSSPCFGGFISARKGGRGEKRSQRRRTTLKVTTCRSMSKWSFHRSWRDVLLDAKTARIAPIPPSLSLFTSRTSSASLNTILEKSFEPPTIPPLVFSVDSLASLPPTYSSDWKASSRVVE